MAQNRIIKEEPAWGEVNSDSQFQNVENPMSNYESNDGVDRNIVVPGGEWCQSILDGGLKAEDRESEMDNEEKEERDEHVWNMRNESQVIPYSSINEMAGEADIGDLLCVKLETEDDWKKEEEYDDVDDDHENASGISIISESLFCKEETDLEKVCSENDELDSTLAETDRQEENTEDDTGDCIEKTTSDPLMLFDCSICQKSFNTKKYLRRHMQIHTGEKMFVCTECQKSFLEKRQLEQHMLVHTGEKPFSCTMCQKLFRSKVGLRYHMLVHTGEKPYNCAVCEKSFSRKTYLTEHMRVHTGEKPFKCVECQKSFAQKGQLITHMRVHTGEKTFHCTICQKSFANKKLLAIHKQLHSGKKLYNCTECQKFFSSKQNLEKHMCVHKGKKPFNCTMCQKSFSSKQNLKRHMSVHELKTPFKCTVSKIVQFDLMCKKGEKVFKCTE